ncbi:MAG: precorrin-2 dehydrogenase/sirohydrochlorin ferrochelatase family protein [Candidatus Methanofastidiosia archaeon]
MTKHYFPIVMEVCSPVIVFGGGEVGMRKIESLKRFGCSITLIDKQEITPKEGVENITSNVNSKNFSSFIPDDTSLVVCALDDESLNDTIAKHCKKKKIPVNVATKSTQGDVVFPAILKEKDNVVATTTLGSCPLCAYAMKQYLHLMAPEIHEFSKAISIMKKRGLVNHMRINILLQDDMFLSLIKNKKIDDAINHVEEKYGHC